MLSLNLLPFALLTSALVASATVLPPPSTLSSFPSLVLARHQNLTLSSFTTTTLSFGPEAIPAECQTSCASTVPIYQSCAANDLDGCLRVCEQDRFNGFMRCVNCEVVYGTNMGVSRSEYYQEAKSSTQELFSSCWQRGKFPLQNVTFVSYDQVLAAINGTAPLPASAITAPSGASARFGGGLRVGVVASIVLSSVALGFL